MSAATIFATMPSSLFAPTPYAALDAIKAASCARLDAAASVDAPLSAASVYGNIDVSQAAESILADLLSPYHSLDRIKSRAHSRLDAAKRAPVTAAPRLIVTTPATVMAAEEEACTSRLLMPACTAWLVGLTQSLPAMVAGTEEATTTTTAAAAVAIKSAAVLSGSGSSMQPATLVPPELSVLLAGHWRLALGSAALLLGSLLPPTLASAVAPLWPASWPHAETMRRVVRVERKPWQRNLNGGKRRALLLAKVRVHGLEPPPPLLDCWCCC